MKILKLDELPWANLPAKKRRVFLRVDFNVALKNEKVVDDFRIRQTLPTIEKLRELGCVVVMGAHLGRPQKVSESERKKLSLLPVAAHLADLLGHEVMFSEEIVGSGVRKLILDARPGELILLENLRFDPREEKNDSKLGESLMEYCDVYINDAFGAAHRAHASIHSAALQKKFRGMGRLLQKEVESLKGVLENPETPQMAIVGGAKLEDKIKVLERLIDTCQKVFVGGRMGFAFASAFGLNTGGTHLPSESVQTAKRLMADAKRKEVSIHFPVDALAATELHAAEAKKYDLNKEIPEDQLLLDIGPKTLAEWQGHLAAAKSVIWNGPMGVFENPVFANGTLGLVDFLKDHAESIKSIVGGGETVAAVGQRKAMDVLFHVSTGGGAMLEFLEGRELPGLEALKLREREVNDLIQTKLAS